MHWKEILKQSKSNLFDVNQFAHHKNHPKFPRFEEALNSANTAFLNQDYQTNSQAFKDAKQILEEMKNDPIQKFFRRKPGSSSYNVITSSRGGINIAGNVGGKITGNPNMVNQKKKYYVNDKEVNLPYFQKIMQLEGHTMKQGLNHYLTGVPKQTLSQVPKDYTAGGAF